MNIAIIGGSYNQNGGRPSGLIAKMATYIKQYTNNMILLHNGGSIRQLQSIYEGATLDPYDVIFWMADVPNTAPKLRDIKAKHPHKLLVTSKRNLDEQYSFMELVNRSLRLKANLTIEFFKTASDVQYQGRLFDPLGTIWCDKTDDFNTIVQKALQRLQFLKNMTRQPTIRRQEEQQPSYADSRFLGIVQESAETFHDLIQPSKEVTRFLGNASFRCRHGFPSYRGEQGIYVSRRNVDKRGITSENFVHVTRGKHGEVLYDGKKKPSVDTPIQLALYETYLNVHFMLHAHVYVEGAPFTDTPVPCGALEEVSEIKKLLPDPSSTNIAINLNGHGCLLMAESVEELERLTKNFTSRPLPEVMM